MTRYVAPQVNVVACNCPHCGAYSHITWGPLRCLAQGGMLSAENFVGGKCSACGGWQIWIKEQMLFPGGVSEPPHDELPQDVKELYQEASSIVSKSPKGAAAILRLAIQRLLPHLGAKGKNINDDIAALVENGLPVLIQQALDVVRVVGNNAVHPGEISLDDTPEMAYRMFRLINFTVDTMIARPKQVDEFYNDLPAAAREAIEKRDH